MNKSFAAKKNQSGQNLVEFALILPLLVMIIFGTLDLGRAFFATITITNAAREGARYGILHPDDPTGMRSAVIDEATNSGFDLGDISVSTINITCTDVASPAGCDRNQPVTVEITYQFELLMGWLQLTPIQLHSSAVMLVP